MVRVVVLGAGVVGLTTAVQLQNALPNAEITVIAGQWDLDTTSAGAGGLFRLWAKESEEPPHSKLRDYTNISAKYWRKNAMSSASSDMGIMPMTLNEIFTEIPEKEMYIDYCTSFQEMSKEQLAADYGPEYVYGYTVGTWVVNGPVFLKYLKRLFTSRGGRCVRRTIANLDEIFRLEADVVVNCTGLGSRRLFNDTEIYAVRGELVQVYAPWIKNVLFVDGAMQIYIIPQQEYVIVGGTWQEDDYDTTPREGLGLEILDRAGSVYPPLKGCRILRHWAGLRPVRKEIRIEAEQITMDGRTVKVVHNYGHGAVGIAISWGCASHATQLVLQQLYVNVTINKAKL